MTKMGRPKVDNAKRKSITVRLSDKTYDELTRYAAFLFLEALPNPARIWTYACPMDPYRCTYTACLMPSVLLLS